MRLCNAPAGSVPRERIAFHGREWQLFVRHGCQATIGEKTFTLSVCICLLLAEHPYVCVCVCEIILYASVEMLLYTCTDGKYNRVVRMYFL